MVGRLASFALGSAISRRRTQAAMSHHFQAQQAQQAQQQEIEKLKAAQASQPQQQQQEDITQQLQKLADLHQKGVLTDEEFKKAKDSLISKL